MITDAPDIWLKFQKGNFHEIWFLCFIIFEFEQKILPDIRYSASQDIWLLNFETEILIQKK
jgi:hypothetical protein